MRRVLALVAGHWGDGWVRELGGARPPAPAATALALGFALMGASVAGDVLRRFHLPRLTGYLALRRPRRTLSWQPHHRVDGRPAAGDHWDRDDAHRVHRRPDAQRRAPGRAAGGYRADDGRHAGRSRSSVCPSWRGWHGPGCRSRPTRSASQRLAMLRHAGRHGVSFSPTMTAAVVADSGARGRLSDTVLAMVVLADLVMLVLFSVSMQLARVVFDTGGAESVERSGAPRVGDRRRRRLRRADRRPVRALPALRRARDHAGAAGGVRACSARSADRSSCSRCWRRWRRASSSRTWPSRKATRCAPPCGAVRRPCWSCSSSRSARRCASMRWPRSDSAPSRCRSVRIGFIRLGVGAGVYVSGIPDDVGRRICGPGWCPRPASRSDLPRWSRGEFPGWGSQLQLLLVASIAIHELVGPILFRRGLAQAGELDAHAGPRPLVVVSNREPYLHSQETDGRITVTAATGGVAVALDALMRERGGVWIAHGAGPADRLVVDAADKVHGAAREPVVRASSPVARGADVLRLLRRLRQRGSVAAVPRGRRAPEVPQRGLGGVPGHQRAVRRGHARGDRIVRRRRCSSRTTTWRSSRRRCGPCVPSARTALFWHIPWPYPDRLRICPWRRELVAGLLANDLLAFQLERDRRNFLMAAEEELGAEVEFESSRVRFGGRTSTVVVGADRRGLRPHSGFAADPALPQEQQRLRELLGLRAEIIGLGVDRLDYTKGIPERLDALDALMTQRPDLRGRLTFVQIGVPSRSDLESYAAIEAEISRRIADLNARHAVPGGSPLVTYYTTAARRLQSGRALPPRALLHRQLAARRHEPGGEGVRRGARRRARGAGAECAGRRGAGARGRADHQSLRCGRLRRGARRGRSTCRRTSRWRACGRCGRSSPDGTSSTGRPTSSRAWKASGPSRCSTPCAAGVRRRCETRPRPSGSVGGIGRASRGRTDRPRSRAAWTARTAYARGSAAYAAEARALKPQASSPKPRSHLPTAPEALLDATRPRTPR